MATVPLTQELKQKRVIWLQVVTLAWMSIECSVALYSAWRARSVSLLAFGSDSFVEMISAIVVLLQFVPSWRLSQARAARTCGTLLFVLAGVVASIAIAGLFLRVDADTSTSGIAITAGALLLMPLLARMEAQGSRRDGQQGTACGRGPVCNVCLPRRRHACGFVTASHVCNALARSGRCYGRCPDPGRGGKGAHARALPAPAADDHAYELPLPAFFAARSAVIFAT